MMLRASRDLERRRFLLRSDKAENIDTARHASLLGVTPIRTGQGSADRTSIMVMIGPDVETMPRESFGDAVLLLCSSITRIQ